MDSWLKEHEIISKLQGASYENCSSKDVALLSNEIISYYRERGETLYVAILDVEKAFDSVWKEGLMFKLFDIGRRGKLWKIIYNSYENFKRMVLANGVISDPFDVERGVHQGASLSMRLYQIFTKDLLKELNEHVMTLKVYQHKIGSPAFADDVVVSAKSKRTMNILYEYITGSSFSTCTQMEV